MNLPCSNCDTDVPEGATQCPACGAGLSTMVWGPKKKGLTRTLIGKAVELRTSIPWANASAVVMLQDPDRPGKMKMRTGARNGFVLLLLAAVAGAGLYVYTRHPEKVGGATPGAKEAKPAVATAPRPEKKEPVPEITASPPAVAAPARAEPMAEKPAPVTPPVAARPDKPAAKVAAAPAPARPAKPGTLTIGVVYKGKSVADARVTVNGEAKGKTPLSLALAPGKYTVKIEKAGFKTEKRSEVEVQPGKKAVLKVELKK